MPDFRAACSYSAHAIADLRLAEVIQGQRAADATTPMASGGESVLSQRKAGFRDRGDILPPRLPQDWWGSLRVVMGRCDPISGTAP